MLYSALPISPPKDETAKEEIPFEKTKTPREKFWEGLTDQNRTAREKFLEGLTEAHQHINKLINVKLCPQCNNPVRDGDANGWFDCYLCQQKVHP